MATYPAMYQPYGNLYGNSYGQYQMQAPQQGPQSYGTGIQNGINWVDGEVGAKAFQMPAGWPADKPIPLWDSNDMVIYLKSINQMGMPNPLQKIRYQMDEKSGGRYGEAQRRMERIESGDAEPVQVNPDMSEYARKDDLESMKKEILDSIRTMNEAKGAKTNGKSAV